jgi:hypothetical protein
MKPALFLMIFTLLELGGDLIFWVGERTGLALLGFF